MPMYRPVSKTSHPHSRPTGASVYFAMLTFAWLVSSAVVSQADPSTQPTTRSEPSASPPRIQWSPLSFSQALSRAKQEEKSILLDMYATWCLPCKRFEAEVFSKPHIAAYVHRHFIPLKRDGFAGEGRTLAKRYNCVTYPCILAIDKDGKEIDRITQYIPAQPFLQRIRAIHRGEDTLQSLLLQLKRRPTDAVLRFRVGSRQAYRGESTCIENLRYVAEHPPSQYPWLAPQSLYILARIYYRNTLRDCRNAVLVFREYLIKYPKHKSAPRARSMMIQCIRRLRSQR